MGETADKGRAKTGLELGKARSVDGAGDHLADVIRRFQIRRDDAEDLIRVISRLFRRLHLDRRRFRPVQPRHRAAGERQGVGVILREMIRDA